MWHRKFRAKDVYFLADPHYQHKGICKGVSHWDDKSGCRNFNTTQEMDIAITNSINDVVPETAYLFIIGDIIFGKKDNLFNIVESINCKNLIYLFGNHCEIIRKNQKYRDCFIWCGDYLEISVEGKLVCLFHYPIETWRDCHKGSLCICGHTHKPDTSEKRRINVGWENYKRPLQMTEVFDILNNKSLTDHH